MADIIFSNLKKTALPVDVREDGMWVQLDPHGSTTFSVSTADVEIRMGESVHRYASRHGVVYNKNGAKALPYFECGGAWHVVMIEQFRIAIPGKTIEAAGGEHDDEVNPDVRVSMARELEEEARIKVAPERIRVVFSDWIQPSRMPGKAHGGIVEITEDELPKELLGGEHHFGEYTVVAVHPLLDLLRARDAGILDIDLETHLLLDAVAKELGFLVKRY